MIEGYAEVFYFQIKYTGINKYSIQRFCSNATISGCSYFDTREGGDVTANTYIPISSPENSLNITHYDSVTNEIKGTFRITFVKDLSQQQLNPAPDTLRFTDGEFETVLERK